MATDPHIPCPGCGTVLVVPPDFLGKPATCSQCGRLFVTQSSTAIQPPPAYAPAYQPHEEEAPPSRAGGYAIAALILLGLMMLPAAGLALVGWKAGWFAGGGSEISSPARDKMSGSADSDAVKPTGENFTADPKPSTDSPPRRFALLVGLDHCGSKDFPILRHAETDIEALASVLLRGGYDKENVVVLTGKRSGSDAKFLPTPENIRQALSTIAVKATPSDLLLVALAGHAVELERGKHAFCTYKVEKKEDGYSGLLPVADILDEIGKSKAAARVLLLDVDRLPVGQDRYAAEGGLVTSMTAPANVLVLHSCAGGEHSWEADGLKSGLFLYHAIEGLNGRANFAHDGKITHESLIGYLEREVSSYARNVLHRSQRPFALGSPGTQSMPLIEWPASEKSPTTPSRIPMKHLDVSEDFLSIKTATLPDGWKGRDLRIGTDKTGRKCLEAVGTEGLEYAELPKVTLKGDCFVEIDYLLDGVPFRGSRFGHTLAVTLEGRDGADRVHAEVDHHGQARVGSTEKRAAARYKPFALTRFRLEREGGYYRILLNDEFAVGGRLDEVGDFDTVQIGLSAGSDGAGGIERGWKLRTPARIYSVKVGRIADPPKEDIVPLDLAKQSYVVDMTRTRRVRLPAGWRGEEFYTATDANKAGCLEARGESGVKFVSLPKLTIDGDFFLEAEAELDGAGALSDFASKENQHLVLLLHDRSGGRLRLEADHSGRVTLGGSAARTPPRFERKPTVRVRIEREGKLHRVWINDLLTVGLLDSNRDLEKIELGLTAGAAGWRKTPARLYRLKLARLKPAVRKREDAPKPPAGGLREDFETFDVGTLPRDWRASSSANIAIQPGKSSKGLELIRPAREDAPGDSVHTPDLDLPGGFVASVECEAGTGASVALLLSGTRTSFTMTVTGEKKLRLPDGTYLDVAKQWRDDGEPQLLRIERTATQYVVKLNDKEVTTLGLGNGQGTFTSATLTLQGRNERTLSPRVTSVRIVPVK